MRRRRAALFIALFATCAVAGMAHAISAAAAPVATVDIQSYRFTPGVVTVHVGDTVTWTNHDRAAHDVTFASGLTSGSLATGESWSYTFAEPGTVSYVCQVHPDMTGRIEVSEAAAPATTEVAPLPSTVPAPRATTPVTEPPVVTAPVRNRFTMDPRLLIAAGLSGVIVCGALLIGRSAARA